MIVGNDGSLLALERGKVVSFFLRWCINENQETKKMVMDDDIMECNTLLSVSIWNFWKLGNARHAAIVVPYC